MECVTHQLGARAQLELAVDVGPVCLDRTRRNSELAGALDIRVAERDQPQHPGLADGQTPAGEGLAKRRKLMKSRNDYDIGCPLCWAPPTASPTQTSTPGPGIKD